MDVPITVEQSYRIYLFTGPIALLSLWPAVQFLSKRVKSGRWPKIESKAAAAFLALSAFVAVILLEPVGWQFRADDDAVTLRAPIDFSRTAGRIPWSDVSHMRIVLVSGRSSRWRQLEISGVDGSQIELAALEDMPKSFGPAFMAIVERHTPVTALEPDVEGFRTRLSAALASPEGPDHISLVGYVVRDSSGRVMQ
jgi:hypothetical protein